MSKEIKQFNIRVYGLLIRNNTEILLSDEYVLDTFMTKFPGGGLEFGEGPEDCIKRECMEELGQRIEIIDHYYTTGFYQKALFYTDHQLISIYYLIKLSENPQFEISTKAFDFQDKTNGNQSFRWVNIQKFEEEKMTFPIDRFVMKILRNTIVEL